MKHRTTEEKLADDARLLRAWKKWHAEERAAVLAGPHGSVLAELFRMFENLKHVQPAQLIGFAHTIDGTAINYDTRFVLVYELSTAITTIHEKHGLPPIDDGLPGEPDTPSPRDPRDRADPFPSPRGRPPRRSAA
jgi:hypothetical protein